MTDASSKKSWWSVLNDGAPLPRAYHASGPWRHGKMPFSDQLRWIAAAVAHPTIKTPGVQILSQVHNGTDRTLTLKLVANGNDWIDLVAPKDCRIKSAGVQGFVRPIDPNESGNYTLKCAGRSCEAG